MASLLDPTDAILFDSPEETVTVEDDIRWVIPPNQRDRFPDCTHLLIPAGSTATVHAVGVLADTDVVVLRLRAWFCMVEADALELSVEERDAIRRFTSSVVHKADNDGGGVDEESSSSEEDSDGGDPDFEGEKPPSLKRAAAAGDGPRKRGDGPQKREGPRAIILDDAGFPLWPGGARKQLRDCNDDEVKAYHEAQAKKEAAADLAGADEFKAAVKAFKASPLAEKDNFVAIVDELKSWVARGGTAATAAGWIRRLMIATKRRKGGDGLNPTDVRFKYTRTSPGAA